MVLSKNLFNPAVNGCYILQSHLRTMVFNTIIWRKFVTENNNNLQATIASKK
jgi:hypothetical protein